MNSEYIAGLAPDAADALRHCVRTYRHTVGTEQKKLAAVDEKLQLLYTELEKEGVPEEDANEICYTAEEFMIHFVVLEYILKYDDASLVSDEKIKTVYALSAHPDEIFGTLTERWGFDIMFPSSLMGVPEDKLRAAAERIYNYKG